MTFYIRRMQGWICCVCVGGGEGFTPLALARGGARGVLFFMIKPKNIRHKMIFSNLSNDIMIQQLQ